MERNRLVRGHAFLPPSSKTQSALWLGGLGGGAMIHAQLLGRDLVHRRNG